MTANPQRRVVEIKSAGFDHQQDQQAVFETSDDVRVVSSFDQLGLKEDLLRGIYAYNFEKPSAIQQRVE